jgi:hypothetical protein
MDAQGFRLGLWRPVLQPPPLMTMGAHTSAMCSGRCNLGVPDAASRQQPRKRPLQANQQKLRLETKQRAARKAAEIGEAIRPRWFKPLGTPMGEGIAYVRTLQCHSPPPATALHPADVYCNLPAAVTAV